MTFIAESSARDAVSGAQGKSSQGRVLTVSAADARGTAAAALASSNTSNNNTENDDDVEWKTAPPARKNKNSSEQAKKKDTNNSHGKKKVSRSWDEWAAPTAKVSQRQVPQSVPLVSPEAKSEA